MAQDPHLIALSDLCWPTGACDLLGETDMKCLPTHEGWLVGNGVKRSSWLYHTSVENVCLSALLLQLWRLQDECSCFYWSFKMGESI